MQRMEVISTRKLITKFTSEPSRNARRTVGMSAVGATDSMPTACKLEYYSETSLVRTNRDKE
jgi:hypothetical protein